HLVSFKLQDAMTTDVSSAALRLAKKNAARHGVAGRIMFRKVGLIAPARAAMRTSKAAVIVANLPYIPTAEVRKLSSDVKNFEPRMALDGGNDGLEYYYKIIGGAAALPSKFVIIFEILPKQYRPLAAFMKQKLPGIETGKILNHQGVTIGFRAYGTTM
ncbi:MAG: hypothetical protein AAB692_03190, partial [Patescibacteria group bacterium]